MNSFSCLPAQYLTNAKRSRFNVFENLPSNWCLQSPPLDLIDTGKGLKVQTATPHLVSLGSGRLSVAITLLPLKEGKKKQKQQHTHQGRETDRHTHSHTFFQHEAQLQGRTVSPRCFVFPVSRGKKLATASSRGDPWAPGARTRETRTLHLHIPACVFWLSLRCKLLVAWLGAAAAALENGNGSETRGFMAPCAATKEKHWVHPTPAREIPQGSSGAPTSWSYRMWIAAAWQHAGKVSMSQVLSLYSLASPVGNLSSDKSFPFFILKLEWACSATIHNGVAQVPKSASLCKICKGKHRTGARAGSEWGWRHAARVVDCFSRHGALARFELTFNLLNSPQAVYYPGCPAKIANVSKKELQRSEAQ